MEECVIKYKDNFYLKTEVGYKKIILTTDQDLIKDGVQEIDDEFLEWFVKNPSCEEVKIKPYCEKLTCQNDSCNVCCQELKYKITIPKEEPKQETLEEAAKNFVLNHDFSLLTNIKHLANRSFQFGAKWQQKNSYTEEDMKNAFNAGSAYATGSYKEFKQTHSNFKEWFKQYKK